MTRLQVGIVDPTHYKPTSYLSLGVLVPLDTRMALVFDVGYWSVQVQHTQYFETRVLDVPFHAGMQFEYPLGKKFSFQLTGGFGIHFIRDAASFNGIHSSSWRREPGLFAEGGLWFRPFHRHHIGVSVAYEFTHTFNQFRILGGYIFRF